MNALPGLNRKDMGFIGIRHVRMMGVVIIMTSLVLPKIVGAQYLDLDSGDFRHRLDFLSSFANGYLQVAQIDQSQSRSQGGLFVDAMPPAEGLSTSATSQKNSVSNPSVQDSTKVEGPEPKDLIERIGGMPMDVPPLLDDPVDTRQKAILDRQRVLNRFNPALGLVFEPVYGYTQRRQRFVNGDGKDARREVGTRLPSNSSAALRTIELFAAADVDTFARAYMIASGHSESINSSGSEEFGNASFEIEEAAIQTTSLPFNLSVRGGRFFADWGYLGRRHAHDLPQIDVPPSLQQLFLNNRTDGIEVNWLAPTPFYFNLAAGWGFNFGQLGEGPLAPFQQQVAHGDVFFGAARTYFDLDDDHNIELGFSGLYAPKSNVPEAEKTALLTVDSNDDIDRYVLNWDFHYRWYPLGRGLRQSFSLHGEILYDWGQGRRDELGRTVSQGAWGGYTYLEYRISKRWRPGFRFDYHQLPSEPALVTNPFTGLVGSTANSKGERTDVRTYSPYITFYPSEFQRFILQYNHSSWGNASNNNQVVFQWEVVIGSHQHGFTERD